jgi:hypothetical protein
MRDRVDTGRPWIRWATGATLTLIAALVAVFWGGFHSALLLGWAVGMILAATLILFRRAW